MYSKFNCVINDDFYFDDIEDHYETGRAIYEDFKQQSKRCLKPFLLDNGHIDGSALKDNWFTINKADVFISHSHKDIEKVTAFAGWLKNTFGLTAFIDSCVWGYCDDLLKQIDDKYCKRNNSEIYDYYRRNYSTSHIHVMLSAALLEMIDKTECLIFFNTPQSIYLSRELDKIKGENNQKTLSPWIYYELSTANTIRPRTPERIKRLSESLEHFDEKRVNDSMQMEYDISAFIDNMPTLNDDLLDEWEYGYSGKKHALDVLYKLVSRK